MKDQQPTHIHSEEVPDDSGSGIDMPNLSRVDIPELYLCPLTDRIMHDPVSFNGGIYEREALGSWLKDFKIASD